MLSLYSANSNKLHPAACDRSWDREASLMWPIAPLAGHFEADKKETKCYIKFPENKSTLALHFKRM